jgi:hypothetical protein
MLDRRAEHHFLRLLTQKNSNSDLIPHELDATVDEDDLPVLDSWTDRIADDLWLLGDKVEIFTPIDIKFTPWYEGSFNDDQGKIIENIVDGWMDHVGNQQHLDEHCMKLRVMGNRQR